MSFPVIVPTTLDTYVPYIRGLGGGWGEQMNKIPLQNKRTQEIQPRGKTHPQPRSKATTTIEQNYTI